MSAERDNPRTFLAPSAPWLVAAMATPAETAVIGHHIGGRSEPGGNRTGPVYNPATGATIAQALFADAATVERAVAAAHNALPAWANTAPARRARVLFRFKELIEARF